MPLAKQPIKTWSPVEDLNLHYAPPQTECHTRLGEREFVSFYITFYITFYLYLVDKVGFEPTMFLMWRIYSPLPSTNSAHLSRILESSDITHRHLQPLNIVNYIVCSGGPREDRTLISGSTDRCNSHYTIEPY